MRGGTLQTCWILFYRKNSCPRARARIRVCVCMTLFSLQTCHLKCGNANGPTPSSLVHTVHSLRVLLSLAAWSFFFFIAEYKIYLFLQVVVAKVSDLKPFFIRTVLCINKQPVPGRAAQQWLCSSLYVDPTIDVSSSDSPAGRNWEPKSRLDFQHAFLHIVCIHSLCSNNSSSSMYSS